MENDVHSARELDERVIAGAGVLAECGEISRTKTICQSN